MTATTDPVAYGGMSADPSTPLGFALATLSRTGPKTFAEMTSQDSQAQFDALKSLADEYVALSQDRENLRADRDNLQSLHSNQMRNATADMAEIDRLKTQVANLLAVQSDAESTLAAYKERVYEVALDVKRSESWCDSGFRDAMARLDIPVTQTINVTFTMGQFDLREVEVPPGREPQDQADELRGHLGRVIVQAVRDFWDRGTNVEASDVQVYEWDGS